MPLASQPARRRCSPTSTSGEAAASIGGSPRRGWLCRGRRFCGACFVTCPAACPVGEVDSAQPRPTRDSRSLQNRRGALSQGALHQRRHLRKLLPTAATVFRLGVRGVPQLLSHCLGRPVAAERGRCRDDSDVELGDRRGSDGPARHGTRGGTLAAIHPGHATPAATPRVHRLR